MIVAKGPGLVLSGVILFAPAEAVSQSATAVQTEHHVDLQASLPGLHMEVREENVVDWGEPPFAECTGSCRLELPSGLYYLSVVGPKGSGIRSASEVLSIHGNSQIHVEPTSRSQFATGIVMMATGGALLTLGTFGWMVNTVADRCAGDRTPDHSICRQESASPTITPLVAGLMIGGAGLAAAGLVLTLRNLRPHLTIMSGETASSGGAEFFAGYAQGPGLGVRGAW